MCSYTTVMSKRPSNDVVIKSSMNRKRGYNHEKFKDPIEKMLDKKTKGNVSVLVNREKSIISVNQSQHH